jgi:hypothetical protein
LGTLASTACVGKREFQEETREQGDLEFHSEINSGHMMVGALHPLPSKEGAILNLILTRWSKETPASMIARIARPDG